MQESNFGDIGKIPGPESVSGWTPKTERREGPLARAIEQRTARIPSDVFLWTSVGCMAGSAALHIMGQKHLSLFVGQWAPTLLILGLYNKLAKVAGSD